MKARTSSSLCRASGSLAIANSIWRRRLISSLSRGRLIPEFEIGRRGSHAFFHVGDDASRCPSRWRRATPDRAHAVDLRDKLGDGLRLIAFRLEL